MKVQPKTVLIYAPCVGRGGVRRLVLRLLNTWLQIADSESWQFRVLSQPVDGNGDPLPWPAGVYSPVSGEQIRENLGGKLCEFLQSNQDAFWQELKKHAEGVDIVWLPQPWWTLRMTSQTVDIPAHIIPTVHDFAFDELNWNDLFGDRFRDEARNFVAVSHTMIYSSHCMAKNATERYGMAPEQGRVVYLADFVPEAFDPTQAEASRVAQAHGLPPRYWLAFHATGHKDPLTIFEALVQSKMAHGANFIPLVIAGVNTDAMRPDSKPGDPISIKVHACVKQHGLVHGRDYFVLGFVPDEDIAGLYKGATGCIVASRSEAGFNASIFEAQRAKTPLIHSDIPPFMERLGTENRYGTRFKCGDANELFAALDQSMRSPEQAREKAEAAFAQFCHRTWDDVARDYLQIFEKACADGPSNRVWSPATDSIQRSPVVTVSPAGSEIRPPKTLSRRLNRLLQKVRRKLKLNATGN